MSFSGINLAARSILGHQRALEVTGQNIANAQTPGYSRQVAVTRPVSGPAARGLAGAGNPLYTDGGVEVATVYRTHAAWLDRASSALGARAGEAETGANLARRVEDLLQEPTSSGLQSTLDRFFSAAGSLASRPDDLAARNEFLRTAGSAATRFQQLTEGMDEILEDAEGQFQRGVEQVNTLLRQVASLTENIGRAWASGAIPSELLDQRDQALHSLSEKIGISVTGQEHGPLVVSLNGRTLVQENQVTELSVSAADPFALVTADTGEAVGAPGGQLRALADAGTSTIPDIRSRLAAFRDSFAGDVNALHQAGTGLDGTTGTPLFTTDATGNLVVNPVLTADPRQVAAGDGSAGDGRTARQIAALGNPAGALLSEYGTLVSEVGLQARNTALAEQQSRLALEQIQEMQASETGVNLDEELARMVSIQHAYSASARLLSTFSEVLETLIHTGA